MADSAEQFLDIIDNRIEKHLNSNTYNYVKQRMAIVTAVDNDTQKVYVYFIDDENQTQYVYYNKTGETISEGDNVRVFYTSDIIKGWIGSKSGQPSASTVTEQNPMYISAKVTNTQAISYDKFERGLLSVDFNVDGTDSNVVFTGNQLCDVTVDGDLNCIYKVDGATQDFKPVETFAVGKRVFSHIYPMTLTKGKHNFAIYILSPDGGKGMTNIGDIVGALSGQISGLKNNAPPNENLILYFEGVLADTEITLPKNMYYGGKAQKYVDWGDGSEIKASVDSVAVSHTYTAAGNYTITIKCSNTNFANGSNKPTFSDSFNQYIKRIYFPDGANTIYWGSSTSNFANLETLVFGKSATYISWDFKTSTEITSLFIPETAITVYPSNFKNTKVSSLIIPQNVASLNGNTNLGACPSLKTFEVYGSVETGVRGSVNLQRLVIGGNVTKIGYYDGCTSLSEVEFPLPSKITEIRSNAFGECTSLASIDIPRTVKTIGQEAFYKCTSLQSIDLPDLIPEIGLNTFYGCTSLSRVKIGSKLTSIGQNAFKGCTSLSEINFPDGLTTIASFAFENTGAISPEFPKTLTKIDTSAFRNSRITSAHLWGNTTCGSSAFINSGLRTLIIDDGFGTIPTGCFSNTTALESVDIPGSVAIISDSAFKGSGVTSLSLSEGLQQIGRYAFQESRVQQLIVPSTVNNIDYYAFENCDNLTSVKISGNTKLGLSVFAHCNSLTSVDMGNTNIIPSSTFSGCNNLVNISFALNTAIEAGAFRNCGFRSLSLLSYIQTMDTPTDNGGIYNIGTQAFQNCSSLTSVDGYEYKFDVLETCAHYNPVYDTSGNITGYEFSHYTYTIVANGIYNRMSAINDSVFSGTGLKDYTDYPNKQVSTKTERYSYSNQTKRDFTLS